MQCGSDFSLAASLNSKSVFIICLPPTYLPCVYQLWILVSKGLASFVGVCTCDVTIIIILSVELVSLLLSSQHICFDSDVSSVCGASADGFVWFALLCVVTICKRTSERLTCFECLCTRCVCVVATSTLYECWNGFLPLWCNWGGKGRH